MKNENHPPQKVRNTSPVLLLALVVAGTIIGIIATSVYEKYGHSPSSVTAEQDSLKVMRYDKLFPVAAARMPDKKIPREYGLNLVNEYERIYSPTGNMAEIAKTHTRFITFKKDELMKWMADLSDSTDMNSVRVYLGVYVTDKIPATSNGTPVHKGRLTVALWPFNKDKYAKYTKPRPLTTIATEDTTSAEPYNIGDLTPP